MSTNTVHDLINQQYGRAIWRQYDSVFCRLRCEADRPHLSTLCESAIFTCKNAPKPGSEHIVGMANENGHLVVMDTESEATNCTDAHSNAIFDLAWKFDQMQLVTASGDRSSMLYDMADGDFRHIRTFCGHSRSVKTVAFRKDDSSAFATGSRDGNIIIWDTRTQQHSSLIKPDSTIRNSHGDTPFKVKRRHGGIPNLNVKSVTSLVFQNINTLISCGSYDGMIKVWDLRKHYTVYKKDPLPKYSIRYSGTTGKNGCSNLVIDNAGVRLYANCLDSTIYCYNIATYNPEPMMKYRGHQNNTFYIRASLSKDENYLVSGSTDENAYIWNLGYPQPIVKLVGHSSEVSSVAWCNRKAAPALVTCSDDMSYKLWKISNLDSTDNEQGRAEILPFPANQTASREHFRKRRCFHEPNLLPKKTIWQCKNCQRTTFTNTLCDNCLPPTSKRKADSELFSESKRIQTSFGPRRLFAHLARNFKKDDTSDQAFPSEEDSLSLKPLNKALGNLRTEDLDNLPNFVVDGMAPHLNYSPPKRRPQDWLTRLRIERNFQQEIMGHRSPKAPRLEMSPKGNIKTCTSANSPLLRFFKVTSSNGPAADPIAHSPKSRSGVLPDQNSDEPQNQ
ncbi:protein lethal(2)denticleless isoform X3 [Dendroctonus ponderosae]|uniref:protein lethal(2)denticleless isoform X3 n=1 Tax=Dendroctonus ponderosae TaxID=77166 RepID=UPI002035D053|nr:protein lethal(2)denticleless isoform X3 [Dendroctonus ponderosae]